MSAVLLGKYNNKFVITLKRYNSEFGDLFNVDNIFYKDYCVLPNLANPNDIINIDLS
jgi:hypothetical protein